MEETLNRPKLSWFHRYPEEYPDWKICTWCRGAGRIVNCPRCKGERLVYIGELPTDPNLEVSPD